MTAFRFLLSFLFVCCCFLHAAPRPREVGLIEIDLSPLKQPDVVITKGFKTSLYLKAKDGTEFKDAYTCNNNNSLSPLRGLLCSSPSSGGWKVKKVGDFIVVIEGYKDSPLAEFEIKVESDEVKNMPQPKVKRLPEQKQK